MIGRIVEKNDQYIVLKAGEGEDAVSTTIFQEDINRILTEEDYSGQTKLIPIQMMEPGFEKTWEKGVLLPSTLSEEQETALREQKESIEKEARTRKADMIQPKGPAEEVLEKKKDYAIIYLNCEDSSEDENNKLTMSIKNMIRKRAIGPLTFELIIDGETVQASPIVVELLKPGEEKEVDISYALEAYRKQKNGTKLSGKVLRFEIVAEETGDVDFQKELGIY